MHSTHIKDKVFLSTRKIEKKEKEINKPLIIKDKRMRIYFTLEIYIWRQIHTLTKQKYIHIYIYMYIHKIMHINS